jgi:hydroxypyruvate isomerase
MTSRLPSNPGSPGRDDMKKSLCIEMFFTDKPFAERFRLAREAGFDYIEFWSWVDKDIPAIKELCQRYGLGIASFSGDQSLSLIDVDQRADYLRFVERSLEVAGFLGCENLVIHSNGLGDGGVVLNSCDHLSRLQKIEAMAETLKGLAPRAEEARVTLLLEALNTRVDHPGNFLTSTTQAAEIVGSIGSPWIKILYDIYHMQIMEGNILSTLRRYADRIGYIHIADVPGRHEPGTGEIHFPNVMTALNERGYGGFVGFELSPLREPGEAASLLLAL